MREKTGRKINSKEQLPAPTRAPWMITFADLCTLLLTFFVLLVSMSSLDAQAIRKALQNFGQKGGLLFFQKLEDITHSPMVVLRKVMGSIEDIRHVEIRKIEELQELSEEQLEHILSTRQLILYRVNEQTKALTLILNNDILFESASAQLKPAAYPVLDSIATFLKTSSYMAFIDGHTDNLPPAARGQFSSNDELSFARAKAVLEYLIEKGGVPPEKLAAGAYGDRIPLGDNSTPAGRALNRRVEITLKPVKSDS